MDREKVIKDLEECLSASCRGFRPRLSCPYNDEEWDIMRDVLALLKEQDKKIKALEDKNKKVMLLLNHQLEKEREQPKIVRCKECHYGQKCVEGNNTFQCFKWNSGEFGVIHESNWFCADGEAKD